MEFNASGFARIQYGIRTRHAPHRNHQSHVDIGFAVACEVTIARAVVILGRSVARHNGAHRIAVANGVHETARFAVVVARDNGGGLIDAKWARSARQQTRHAAILRQNYFLDKG